MSPRGPSPPPAGLRAREEECWPVSQRGDGGLSHGLLLGVSTGCQRAVEGQGAGRSQQRPGAWPGLLSPPPKQRGDTLTSF